jgi:rod shape-determining protein MreC
MRAGETARENTRLRQLVGWKEKAPWKVKLARVIARDPANWWRAVQIDRGSLDELRENLPILTPDGLLIGRVSAVGLTSARVLLIGDPNCKVPATILGESAESGIITSAGLFSGSFVNLTYLANRANIKPGQSVVTSGLSAIYPKGIPIGTVADTRTVESGLYTEAQVKLAANLNALEEVWVLFP